MKQLSPGILKIVGELTPLVRTFSRSDYGIAVGGAHAKGVEDTASDLDLYLFAEEVLTCDNRRRETTDFSSRISHVICWGEDDPFEQGGTDFEYEVGKVECWLRHIDVIEGSIAEGLKGIVRCDRVTWTPNGFYNHCALSDVDSMVVIDDPTGMLAHWKAAIAVYPSRLRGRIISTHLDAARFWPANFHYDSAIQRQDVIYTTSIVQQVLHNLVQVLFAVNEVYFPGDKKMDGALARLDRLPVRLAERMRGLIWPGEAASVAVLKGQQADLQALLAETESLVEATPI